MTIQNWMIMITRQNNKGDFVLHLSFLDGAGAPAAVPSHLEINLTTDLRAGVFRAEFLRDGACEHCKESGDGIDVFVALSRCFIGSGRMVIETVEHLPDQNFEGGERLVRSRRTLPVLLYEGPSDGGLVVVGQIALNEA